MYKILTILFYLLLVFASQKIFAANCTVNSAQDTTISADCEGFTLSSSNSFTVTIDLGVTVENSMSPIFLQEDLFKLDIKGILRSSDNDAALYINQFDKNINYTNKKPEKFIKYLNKTKIPFSDCWFFSVKRDLIINNKIFFPNARFGELEIKDDYVISFQEKPQTKVGWINGGFFVMEPEFLKSKAISVWVNSANRPLKNSLVYAKIEKTESVAKK